MADQNAPKDVARKSKAAGDRRMAGSERGGVPGARLGHGVMAWDEEVLNRHTAETTPRRYEQPLADDNR